MEWTIDSLKEHYDEKFLDIKEATKMALEAAALATAKAEAAHEKRLDSVNEFRQTLADQQATLVRKSEVDLMMKSIEKRLDNVDRCGAEGSGIRIGWGIAIGFIGLVTALIVLITAL